MASRWILSVDQLQLATERDFVPELLFVLFQERDRRHRPRDGRPRAELGEGDTLYEYAASAADVLDRLEILGISTRAAERTFAACRAKEIKQCEERIAQGDHPDFNTSTLKLLRPLTYARWQADVAMLARRRTRWPESRSARAGRITKAFFYHLDIGLGCFDDLLVLVRACLDALPNAREVRLDYTQLVEGELCGPDEELCANARRVQTPVRFALEPIVLLTEGRTDTRFLRASLTALYPHLEDFFTFFDFEESGSSGGTDALARMVRAFVGARVPVRIVALFDNDAAGHAGLKALDGLALPPNVKVLPFPDIEIARTYPTVGPQGESVTDVNGRACGIELYLGRAALTGLEGRLRPVVWTSYDYKSARYQGEVRGKAEVGEAFLRGLAAYQTPQAARDALPELCALWRAVFRVFDMD